MKEIFQLLQKIKTVISEKIFIQASNIILNWTLFVCWEWKTGDQNPQLMYGTQESIVLAYGGMEMVMVGLIQRYGDRRLTNYKLEEPLRTQAEDKCPLNYIEMVVMIQSEPHHGAWMGFSNCRLSPFRRVCALHYGSTIYQAPRRGL